MEHPGHKRTSLDARPRIETVSPAIGGGRAGRHRPDETLVLMKGQATPTYTEEVHMETLALVLAVLFVGQIIDLRRNQAPYSGGSLFLVSILFGGALSLGVALAVTE